MRMAPYYATFRHEPRSCKSNGYKSVVIFDNYGEITAEIKEDSIKTPGKFV